MKSSCPQQLFKITTLFFKHDYPLYINCEPMGPVHFIHQVFYPHTIVWEDSPGVYQEVEAQSHVSEWPNVKRLPGSWHLPRRSLLSCPWSFYSLAIMTCVHCTKCSSSPSPFHVSFFPPRMFFPGLFTKLRPTCSSRLSSMPVGELCWISLAGSPLFITELTWLCCPGLFTARSLKAGTFVSSFISSS